MASQGEGNKEEQIPRRLHQTLGKRILQNVSVSGDYQALGYNLNDFEIRRVRSPPPKSIDSSLWPSKTEYALRLCGKINGGDFPVLAAVPTRVSQFVEFALAPLKPST
jgi:hypothetical protein